MTDAEATEAFAIILEQMIPHLPLATAHLLVPPFMEVARKYKHSPETLRHIRTTIRRGQ